MASLGSGQQVPAFDNYRSQERRGTVEVKDGNRKRKVKQKDVQANVCPPVSVKEPL